VTPYQFRYFVASSDDPVSETSLFGSDQDARAHGASELLRMPGRGAVEVWAGDRLVYARRRRCAGNEADPGGPA
jgi:hypothetical protein